MGVLFGNFWLVDGSWHWQKLSIIFPIFARRIGITKGYSLIVIAIAVGKNGGQSVPFLQALGHVESRRQEGMLRT